MEELIVDKILANLRSGKIPDEQIAHELFKKNFVNLFKTKIIPEDKEIVIDLLKNTSGAMQKLAVMLTRGNTLDSDLDILNCLIELYRVSTDLALKYSLLHEISRRSADDSIKRELLQFIDENYEQYLKWELEYFKGSDQVLDECVDRLDDGFYINKQWIYLITLTGSSNKIEARKLISRYLKSNDHFLVEVAQNSLKKMKGRLNNKFKINYIFVGSFLFLILSWVIIAHSNVIPTLFLPTPSQISISVKSLFFEKDFLGDISISVFRVVAAFLLSAVIAVPMAVLMCSYKKLFNLMSPYIDFTRYLPVPTLIPLTILFFGIDEEAKIVLLFIGTFFQLILLIIDDIHSIPNEYYDLAYTLNYNKFKIMKLQFRSVLPQIYDNCRITLGWCWTYLIIAELVASEKGIGHMIKEAQRFSDTSSVYVGIITMGVIGFFSDYVFKKAYPYLFKYENRL